MENVENQDDTTIEKKLGDLMLRGWTLLADSCPVESKFNLNIACGIPLMRNLNGQKYCVGCEAWHFEKDRPKKQKYGELVSLHGKQDIQVKPTEVQKLPKALNFNKFSLNDEIIQALKVKLAYLANQLNSETDLHKNKEILECMKLCMENIAIANKLD
jgi:uncharacterized Zn finger protein (UPF0148 family)